MRKIGGSLGAACLLQQRQPWPDLEAVVCLGAHISDLYREALPALRLQLLSPGAKEQSQDRI